MARAVIGWENFALLYISTDGILMLYIGNIFIDRKRLMYLGSEICSGGAKVTMHLSCLLPGKPSVEPGASSPVPAVPWPTLCVSLSQGAVAARDAI